MITLKNDLIIEIDESNYTLMIDKHKQDKKGNQVYETLGYYSTLIGALCGAKDYCIQKSIKSGVYTLHEAVDEIKRITDEFKNLLTQDVTGAK